MLVLRRRVILPKEKGTWNCEMRFFTRHLLESWKDLKWKTSQDTLLWTLKSEVDIAASRRVVYSQRFRVGLDAWAQNRSANC